MLDSKFRYVGLDFETTGLDTLRDEPIQIGIVELDCQGDIVSEYQSYLKPKKDIKELKQIVGFVTGLSVDDLQGAPTPEEIFSDVEKFFGEKTILVGHNIAFDKAFLERFFPGLSWYAELDTFQLSQALVHYAPSYALEVLVEHLEKNQTFLPFLKKFGLVTGSGEKVAYHDALVDTKATLALFSYLLSSVNTLCREYYQLSLFLELSVSLLREIIPHQPLDPHAPVPDGIFLPPLKRISPPHTRLLYKPYEFDLTEKKNFQRFFIGNLSFKDLLASLLTQQKMILAFSNKAKLDIAKNLLNDMGVKNIGFAREEQTINEKLLIQFVNKGHFDHTELSFLIKYLSHLYQGYGTLDLNTKMDYQVYFFIKDTRKQVEYPLVLTTHQGLFSVLENEKHTYASYDIGFFDVEWWYKNYNFYLSRPCDLYYLQNFLDMMLYKYGLQYELGLLTEEKLVSLKAFDSFFSVFLGVLWIDTKKLFTHTDQVKVQVNPLIGNGDFYWTNLLLSKLHGYEEILKSVFSEADFHTFWSQIDHFLSLCEGIVTVEKKMWSQADFYFLFSEESRYTNWDEFTEVFSPHKATFFSNRDQQCSSLVPSIPFQKKGRPLLLENQKDLLRAIQERSEFGEQIFIFSPIKENSREIFEACIQAGLHQKYELLVENITGGVGKNVFKAQKKFAKIVIGGYNFLMTLFASKVQFSQILIYRVKGPQQDSILDDILWYAPQRSPQNR